MEINISTQEICTSEKVYLAQRRQQKEPEKPSIFLSKNIVWRKKN